MKKTCLMALACLVFLTFPSFARPLHIVAAYPYIGDLVERIGGGNVRVFVLARGNYNPHVIIPRPSFIAQIRRADLLIISGAQLEIGWIPPLLRQANNPAVQPGEPGFLDLSRYVTLIDVPTSVSREQGDVHPEGNPHYYLDPENILPLAKAIMEKLCQLDSQNALDYRTRYSEFAELWNKRLIQWAEKMKEGMDTRVVEYHKNYDYFLRRYKLQIAGTIEPLPGIPPTSKHVEHLEALLTANPARFILQDVYNPDDASRHLAEKLGIKVVVLPHDVGAVREANGVFSLFDEIVRRLTE
ncbi:MAG: zinc ABC transporter substrate-binding protein [Bacteroidota bacterium]